MTIIVLTVQQGIDSIVCIVIAVKYERIKFLVVALKDGIEIYAWAPKPYHKFMAFKVLLFQQFNVLHCTKLCCVTVILRKSRLVKNNLKVVVVVVVVNYYVLYYYVLY